MLGDSHFLLSPMQPQVTTSLPQHILQKNGSGSVFVLLTILPEPAWQFYVTKPPFGGEARLLNQSARNQ